jgi:hypothetical protein
MSIIDSLMVALGFETDTRGLSDFERRTAAARESVFSLGKAMVALAGAAALKGISAIGSEFESNQIAIAGFLSALGLSSDFNAGLVEADKVMNKIITDAARLPGEADEYIQVYRDGLPVLKGAMPGGSPEAMAEFTDTIAAIGKTLKIDAPQIGRDLKLMLSPLGRAGSHVRLFSEMLPFMRQVKGQANLTAQSFNAMTQKKRFELLQATFQGLQPMIDASAESMDAMGGAAKSAFVQLVRLGTKPLFEGMKKGLGQLVGLFFNVDGGLTAFGKDTVATLQMVSKIIVRVVTDIAEIVMAFAKMEHSGAILKLVLLGVTALLRPFALLGSAIFLVAEDLYQFYTGGNSVVGLLAKKWAPAVKVVWGALLLLIGVFIQFGAPGLASGIGKLFGILGGGIGSLIGKVIGLTVKVIALGIAWAAANLPILLVLAGIAAIAIAGYELWKHWDEIMAGMKKGWESFVGVIKNAPHDVAVALGLGTDAETAQRNQAAAGGTVQNQSAGPGSEVVWLNPETGLTETHRPGWKPPATASPAAAGGAAGGAQITIQKLVMPSTDPPEAARAMTRAATRNVRSKVAY